ncbi:serine hydrolase [Streptococcus minor]|nr:serine hydrolase [Streptococcus minor]
MRRLKKKKERNKQYLYSLGMIALLAVPFLVYFVARSLYGSQNVEDKPSKSSTVAKKMSDISPEKAEISPSLPKELLKSEEAKQAVMEADRPSMEAMGLAYDYAHMSLVQVVEAYLADAGIDPSQVAFSYKNPATGHTFSMNETQPMTAGSTYKLPLNMLVVDAVVEGQFTLTERFDITKTDYEYKFEHDAYVNQFGGAMTIPDMQEYSLVYSENTPAYALAERLGGLDAAFAMMDKYGQSKGEIPTIRSEDNKTTTDFYIQVLEHLYRNQEKYADIIYYMDMSFPGKYYETYLTHLRVVQKPGYVGEALNVDAMVFEESPYLIALYTRYLGGSTEYSNEVNGYGYMQLTGLTYVINQWHRVNENGLA